MPHLATRTLWGADHGTSGLDISQVVERKLQRNDMFGMYVRVFGDGVRVAAPWPLQLPQAFQHSIINEDECVVIFSINARACRP